MSCNGCRVLRKGCSESCMLRPCIQWIDTPESQGHATVFVAKFFGRAGLMSFISNVPQSQRPALFQSLLYEACGRTINPVSGAVGLLWTGNWHLCQAAVETVLRGGTPRPIPDFLVGAPPSPVPTTFDTDDNSEVVCPKNNPIDTWQNHIGTTWKQQENTPRFSNSKRRKEECLDLSLTPPEFLHAPPQQRPSTPSEESGASATTVSFGSDNNNNNDNSDCYFQPRLLKLFV